MNGLILICCMAAAGANPDTVVVCPAEFSQAMKPWLTYRAEQGHEVVVVSNLGGEDAVRQRIRQHAKAGQLKFVVLVGDAAPGPNDGPPGWNRCVPVHRAKAEINVLWGSEPHIATDTLSRQSWQSPPWASETGRCSARSSATLRFVGRWRWRCAKRRGSPRPWRTLVTS